jgi:hypothetical protein
MKEYIQEVIENRLQSNFPMLILRGLDSVARDDGDIDILVSPGMANTACRCLVDYIKEDGWSLVALREINYLTTITVANIDLHPGMAVKIDFFGGLAWYGISNVHSQEDVFKKIQIIDRDVNSRRQAIAAVTLLHKVMYAGRFRERDIDRISPHIADIVSILNMPDLINVNFIRLGVINMTTKWRLRFRMSGYQKSGFFIWIVRILAASLFTRIRLSQNSGQFISVGGIRDSINSTYLDQLTSLYSTAGELKPRIYNDSSYLAKNIEKINFYSKKIAEKGYLPISNPIRLAIHVFNSIILRVYIDISVWRGRVIISDFLLANSLVNQKTCNKSFILPLWLVKLILPRGHYINLSRKSSEINFNDKKHDLKDNVKCSFISQDFIDSIEGKSFFSKGESSDKTFGWFIDQVSSLYCSELYRLK